MPVPDPVRAIAERIVLRLPVASDREAFSRLVVESREHLARWANGAPAHLDPDGTRWFERTLAANEEGRSEKLFIVRRADDALLGSFNFNEVTRGALQSAYLGYWMGAPHVRRGYMAEALGAGLSYAFGPLGLHRVEANVQPGNGPSLALVRKAGFRLEGWSPRYLLLDGVWRDHERWALTVEDWARTQNDTGGPEGPPV